MTTLLLIRHGQTAWNLAGKYTGQADIPLNDTGRLQARSLVATMAQQSVDAIYSSDLIRAIETAELAAAECKNRQGQPLTIQTDFRLREISQGVWEGMHFDEIKQRFGAEFAAREANPLEVAAPEGETVGEVQQRVLSAIYDICHEHPHGRVMITGHGLALAIVRIWLLDHPIQDVWSFIPPNAKMIEFECSIEKLKTLKVLIP